MKVMHARQEGSQSELRGGTFTGAVWGDPVMPSNQGVQISNVFFSPGARTHWHQHEHGQVLHVLGGSGWICEDGHAPQRIRTGDVVWIGPGERHWHGADQHSFMMHLAISIGKTDWKEPVTDAQYVKG